MIKDNCIRLFFAIVTSFFFTGHSVVSAADKVVVIPLFKTATTTTTCTAPDEVMSAGQCWKDRNLGATRVATTPWDTLAYGDLYQWGRRGDGHQNRTSPNTGINDRSANDVPGHRNFTIVDATFPSDWRDPQNDNLWQGLGGVNNPCPQGFRIPTLTEANIERLSWVSQNAEGAYNSPLRLVQAGTRNKNGSLDLWGGSFWTSTSNPNHLNSAIYWSDNSAIAYSMVRASGRSVRCIKN